MPEDVGRDEVGSPDDGRGQVPPTRADALRHRADDIDNEADQLRWTNPTSARHLQRVARDLRRMADNLPPERGQQ